jgi:hypothetical protein
MVQIDDSHVATHNLCDINSEHPPQNYTLPTTVARLTVPKSFGIAHPGNHELTIRTMKTYSVTLVLLPVLAGLINQVAGTFVVFIEDDSSLLACGGEGVASGNGTSCPCIIGGHGAEVVSSLFDLTLANFSVVTNGTGGFCGQEQLDFYHETVPFNSASNLVFYLHNGDGTPLGACTPGSSADNHCDGWQNVPIQIIYECFDDGSICNN